MSYETKILELVPEEIKTNKKFIVDEYLLSDKIIFPFTALYDFVCKDMIYPSVIWTKNLSLFISDKNEKLREVTIIKEGKLNTSLCEVSHNNDNYITWYLDFDKIMNEDEIIVGSLEHKSFEEYEDEYTVVPLDKMVFTKKSCIEAMNR